jgi:hypothetical protein
VQQYPQGPGHARIRADGFRNLSFCTEKPVTHDHVTGYDLQEWVAGVGFEPT